MLGTTTSSQFRFGTSLPKHTLTPFRLSLLIGCVLIGIAGIGYWKLQPEIPIFYSLAQSSQQLAPKYWIFLFPFLSFLTTLTNFTLIKRNSDLETVLVAVISWTTVAWQFLLMLTCVRLLAIIW